MTKYCTNISFIPLLGFTGINGIDSHTCVVVQPVKMCGNWLNRINCCWNPVVLFLMWLLFPAGAVYSTVNASGMGTLKMTILGRVAHVWCSAIHFAILVLLFKTGQVVRGLGPGRAGFEWLEERSWYSSRAQFTWLFFTLVRVDYKGRTDLHASAAAHSEVENCGWWW